MPAADRASAAERIARFVDQLLDQVVTEETIQRPRRVDRGSRVVAVLEASTHRTEEPALLDQLQAVASRPTRPLQRVPITRGNGEQLRAPVQDDHGRPLMSQRWDKEAGRSVQTPATVPLTRVRRAPSGSARTVRPGALVPGGSAGWDADGALAPGRRGTAESRAPVTEALDVFLSIDQEARARYARLLAAAAAAGHTRDAKPRHALGGILRHMVSLAAVVPARDAEAAARDARSWVTSARTVIGYEAPIVMLRDICCPDCGGRLAVRTDGSTPVWCTGLITIIGPAAAGERWPIITRCPLKYDRHQWLDLFAPGETEPIGDAPRRPLPRRYDGNGGRA